MVGGRQFNPLHYLASPFLSFLIYKMGVIIPSSKESVSYQKIKSGM